MTTGRQYDWTLDSLVGGQAAENGNKPIDWDRTVSRLVRAMPIGVTLDRARKALQVSRQEDAETVRRPVAGAPGLGQALGVEPIPAMAPQVRPMEKPGVLGMPGRLKEATAVGLGVQTPERETRRQMNTAISEMRAHERGFVEKAAEIAASGDIEGALAMLKKHGVLSPLTARAIHEAAARAVVPQEIQKLQRSPRVLRGRTQELLEEYER